MISEIGILVSDDMKIILVSKCSLDIEEYVEFKMSVLISPSKILISSHRVTNVYVSNIVESVSFSLKWQTLTPPNVIVPDQEKIILCHCCLQYYVQIGSEEDGGSGTPGKCL